jgi:membrane protein
MCPPGLFDRFPRRRTVHIVRQSLHVLLDAYYRFDRDDGWAIASHIALSILMSVFPFLIVVTAIAAFIGSVKLADEVARLLLEAWPDEVAGPLATEIHHVLTTSHGGLVTIGGVFALYFSSSGIESLRIGLNRAYGLRERRSFWVLRLESIGFVLLSASALLMLAFLIVLGPLLFEAAAAYVPALAPLESHYDLVRFGVSGVVVVVSLFILHMWLPAGRCGFSTVWPGILATLVLWLICGFTFGHYLAKFAYTYVNYYAGLASAMIALVFLYYGAWIFVYGIELNAAIARMRKAKA